MPMFAFFFCLRCCLLNVELLLPDVSLLADPAWLADGGRRPFARPGQFVDPGGLFALAPANARCEVIPAVAHGR